MKISKLTGLVKFLDNQKAATIAVPIDVMGNIHAASLIFWNSIEPLCFFFITSRNSEKYAMMKNGNLIACAVVVGTEKGTDFTLQMRGNIQEVDPMFYLKQLDAYYHKRGNGHDDISDPQNCFLKFTPTWARYTDYSKGYNHLYIDLD